MAATTLQCPVEVVRLFDVLMCPSTVVCTMKGLLDREQMEQVKVHGAAPLFLARIRDP